MRTLIRLLLLSFLLPVWQARAESYELSLALGLGEVGINKVLCLQDGRTMLFHFENNKPMRVMVFDTSHKRVASRVIDNKVLDVFQLSIGLFKGLYEIAGEGVLFLEQKRSGRSSLIRIRFDPGSGAMIDEKVIARSKGVLKPSRFFVMKHNKESGYAILASQEVRQFRKCKNQIYYYNENHEVYKEVPLIFDRKKYDYMTVIGAESSPVGIFVSLGLSDMVVNGTGSTIATRPIYKHDMHVFFVPEGSDKPIHREVGLPTELMPYYTTYTYNEFADNLNVMLLSFNDALVRDGVITRPVAIINNMFFRFDRSSMEGRYSWMLNKVANKQLVKVSGDTSKVFEGFPVKFFTNRNGLSTLVSESYIRNLNTESSYRYRVYETFLSNICITQFDDFGNEIWAAVLPKTALFRSYNNYYSPISLAKGWQERSMFNDRPPQVFDRQFMSMNVYESGDNFYMIYNDGFNNAENSLANPGDTVFNTSLTNAYYYKVNRKKEVTKHILYGLPLKNEYRSSAIEGADFDEKRGVYASVVRYKRGSYVSMRMAWAKLE